MTPPDRIDQLLSLAATLRRVRWFCIAFTVAQFAMYTPPPRTDLPHAIEPWALPVCAWLLLTNVLSAWSSRSTDVARLERVAAVEVAADAAVALFAIALFSFDAIGVEWALLCIVMLEAAMRLRVRGVLMTWAATTTAYVAIEVWAHDRYDVPLRWNVLTFRLGIVLVIAMVGSGLARQLQLHAEASQRAQDEAVERARLLRIAVDAARSMSSPDSHVLDAVVAAAIDLGFDTAEVCVLEDESGLGDVVREIVDAGSGALLAVPIRVGGVVLASLRVGTKHARPVSPAERECLELLAVQAGAALDADRRQRVERGLHLQLEYSAAHDALTGLPNRAALLEHAQSSIGRDAHGVGVVVGDIDRFKAVNDSLGHDAGDDLLRAVAERLQSTAGDRMVARVGGDEFAIVVERGGIEAAKRLARMLLVDLEEPVCFGAHHTTVSLSIGVAAVATTGDDASTILRDAALALARAKHGGRSRFEVFDPALRTRAQLRMAMENDLRSAVDDGCLRVAYQPMVSLETGEIIAVEALARWNHPDRGPIPPDEFIALAEETGLIHPLGRRVLDLAARQVRAWHRGPGVPVRLSVNLSAVQLTDQRCARVILDVLRDADLDPGLVTMEITESTVIDGVNGAVECVQALSDSGVRFSIDDIGRGWSSLSYLSRYPLSEMKIDRSFVQGVASRPADRAVVRALVSLAHDLGLDVVAEGIEDPYQLAELRRLGCDVGQGFHLHRPLEPDAITKLLVGRSITGVPSGPR